MVFVQAEVIKKLPIRQLMDHKARRVAADDLSAQLDGAWVADEELDYDDDYLRVMVRAAFEPGEDDTDQPEISALSAAADSLTGSLPVGWRVSGDVQLDEDVD